MDKVHKYLLDHGVTANCFRRAGLANEAILLSAESYHSNLIVMSGFGFKPVMEAELGSSVDGVLRRTVVPVLICA